MVLFYCLKWRPAAILNLTLNLKFDSRYEIRSVKTFGKHVFDYFLRLKGAGYEIISYFQYSRRRPSWILKITRFFSLGL